MSTPACPRNVEADVTKHFAGAGTRRVAVSSEARALAFVFAIIGVMAVAPFALLGRYFAPNVAKDLRHQSEVLSQAGDQAGAIAASRKAVDIYRGLMRVSMLYAPRLAASLHDLSNRLHEAGDDAGALAAIHEAIEIRRGLAGHHGANYAASLEQSLQVLTRIEAAQRGAAPTAKTRENRDS
jgi:hypothetical protein